MNLYIILGFLGSGKTTLLKNLLALHKGQINGVIINDFGKEDIDGKLLKSHAKNIDTVYDGSIFCICKSDQFIDAVLKMAERKPENVFVEASGLANPFTMTSVIDIINKKLNGKKAEIKGIFCLIDAANFEKILSVAHMIKMQVAIADIIIINKTDIANEETIFRIENTLRQINSTAKILKAVKADIDNVKMEHNKRELPININDLTLQKLKLTLYDDYNLEDLNNLSFQLSKFSHRIKGVIKIKDKFYIYQYSDNKSELTECNQNEESFLIVLSCMRDNLIKKTMKIVKDCRFLKGIE